jgi:hypothetical protein
VLMRMLRNVETMAFREKMTIQIPDDLARGLEGIAVAQKKTVEQLALDSLRLLFDKASSPEALLRSVRRLPHPSAAAVDDLEAAILASSELFQFESTAQDRQDGAVFLST